MPADEAEDLVAPPQPVAPGGQIEHEPVGALAPVHLVPPRAAGQHIAAAEPAQHIVARPAEEHVAAVVAPQRVVAARAIQCRIGGVGGHRLA